MSTQPFCWSCRDKVVHSQDVSCSVHSVKLKVKWSDNIYFSIWQLINAPAFVLDSVDPNDSQALVIHPCGRRVHVRSWDV